MPGELKVIAAKHGLSFLATLAFAAGFFGARLFHLAFPSAMVFVGEIHFHHFWYGLVMVCVSGWLGIVYNEERLQRICAVVFGLGLGFIGDEVGLLLTFGNYYSELTMDFFVAAISFIILVALFLRYRKQIEREVLGLGGHERLSHIGIFLLGFSSIFFAFWLLEVGVPLAVIGFVLLVWGLEIRRRSLRQPAP